MLKLASLTGLGPPAASSLLMVTVAEDCVPISAPTAPESETVRVSAPSAKRSSVMTTSKVFVVSPGAKRRRPSAAL